MFVFTVVRVLVISAVFIFSLSLFSRILESRLFLNSSLMLFTVVEHYCYFLFLVIVFHCRQLLVLLLYYGGVPFVLGTHCFTGACLLSLSLLLNVTVCC